VVALALKSRWRVSFVAVQGFEGVDGQEERVLGYLCQLLGLPHLQRLRLWPAQGTAVQAERGARDPPVE
jgi:hypothetical protein